MDKMHISLRYHRRTTKDGEWVKVAHISDHDYNVLEGMTMAIEALNDLEYHGHLTVRQHGIAVAKMASDYFAYLSTHIGKVEN